MTDDSVEFDAEFLAYARRALAMAGIEVDPDSELAGPVLHSIMHTYSQVPLDYEAARKACPQSLAHWEQAEFFRPALRAAIWDLQFGAIRNYAQFEFLYSRLLSERAVPFLPSLFAAAALSPAIDAEFGHQLLDTIPFKPHSA